MPPWLPASQFTDDALELGLSHVSGCREDSTLPFPQGAQGLRESEGDCSTVPEVHGRDRNHTRPSPHTSLWHMVCIRHSNCCYSMKPPDPGTQSQGQEKWGNQRPFGIVESSRPEFKCFCCHAKAVDLEQVTSPL